MDLATILGLLMAIGLVGWSMLSGGNASIYFDLPSVLLVVGGALGATMMSFTLPQMMNTVRVLMKAFIYKKEDPYVLPGQIRELAEIARREGLIKLEEKIDEVDNEFLKMGLQLVADGASVDVLKDTLEAKLDYLEQRHEVGHSVFRTMAKFSPAFGMIGTIVGLVQMLVNLDDPNALGPGMSLALLTTLYGSLLANMVFDPIAGKLENRTQEEILISELAIRGLEYIANGENPRVLERKLRQMLGSDGKEQSRQSEDDE